MRRMLVGGGAIAALAIAGTITAALLRQPTEIPAAAIAQRELPAEQPIPVRAAPPQSARRAETTPGFVFRRLLVDGSGNAPESCLRFSEALDPRAEAHYADYLRIEPSFVPALRVTDADLCVGGLVYGTTYRVTLLKGLPSRSGVRIAQDETVEMSLGDRPPLVSIAGDGFILPRATSNGVAIQTVNVERVKVRVLRMSDRLLTSKLRDQNRWNETAALTGRQMTRYQLRTLLRDSASLVWSGVMEIERDHNRTVETAFPLSDVIKPGQTGAYLLIAENDATATPDKFFAARDTGNDGDDDGDLWSTIPTHWVIATDIALTTMSGAGGLDVFARSLASAEPLAGVKFALIAAGQDVLGEATTDAEGHVAFAPGLLHGTGASAAATLAAHGADGDFALINLARPAFDLSDRGVSGRPQPGPVQAFLYTERGIYRPGDTVDSMTLLRDRLGRAIEAMPLTLVLRRPDGVEARRWTLTPQPKGGFHWDVVLTRSAARGLWSLEALVDPAGSPIGRATFEVQDFVPQKLKVAIHSVAPALRPGEPLDVTLDGQFLYGAPAAGLKGEAELRLMRDPAPVPAAKGYRFGLVDEKVDDAVQKLTAPVADDSGHAHISDLIPPLRQTSAPMKAVLSAGLFEPGGRLVGDALALPLRNQPLLVGVKPRFEGDRTEEDRDAVFDVLAFDDAGNPVPRVGLHWRLIRENRVYDWYSTGSSWTWHYHVVDEPIASGEVDAREGGPAALATHVGWGHYRLVVDDPATQAATSVRFQAGWLTATESADTPDKLDVAVEKPVLAADEATRLRIRPPFPGKAQLTIANDRVLETRAIDLPADGATVEISAAEAWGAGAYVLVTLYRPLEEVKAHEPVRAMGLAWIGLDARPRTLQVILGTPERTTPRHSLTVPVKVDGVGSGRHAYVTLAAVDEGILQLTRFASPDPREFLFGKRRLGIDIHDDYGRLLDGSAAAGRIREGGDAAAGVGALGGDGLAVASARTVALFAGPVAVAPDGSATLTLDLPDFEGRLRLMAVAYDEVAVGSAETALTVRDPVVADLALPRFLAPGDRARLALLLHNTDGAAGDYHLDLTAGGAVTLAADHALDYALGSGERRLDHVELTGTDEGVGTIAADIAGPGGYQLHREWQIAVRAAHQPITLEETALQAPGEDFRLDPRLLAPFVPGSVTVSVGYSGLAGIDVPSLLQSLYRYPYGCTEQLSASAFPLVYLNDPALLGTLPRDGGVKQRVQQAVDTILDRQDAAGEFGLWRAGDGQASPWLNAFAVDFLMHAREAGFVVPESGLQRSYAWLARAIRQVGDSNDGAYAQAPDATRAYAGYVLARAGRADIGDLRRLHDALHWDQAKGAGISLASVRWRAAGDGALAQPLSLGHLAGALSLMGDRSRAHSAFGLALANLGVTDYPAWWVDYAYYSATRDVAGLLAVAAETGDDRTAAALVDRLQGLKLPAAQLNTQEKAWLLAAAHALAKDDRARSLSVNGHEIAPLKLPAEFAPKPAEIESGWSTTNSGDRGLWRTLVIAGAPEAAPSAMAAGYALTRRYLALDGTPVDPARLAQNARIIVSLSGRAEDSNDHRTVVVDPLPAGWEIEAPITRAEEYGFLGPLSKTRIEEARDDRFVAAFDLGDGLADGRAHGRWHEDRERNDNERRLAPDAFHVAYLARVVTPGKFVLPEAVVEDMYRPGVMARTEASDTTAEPR